MAGEVIDELVTTIDLKETKSSKKVIDAFNASLNTISKNAVKMGLALAAGAGALGTITNKLGGEVRDQQLFAKRLGISVQGLQAIEHAATQARIPIGTLTQELINFSASMKSGIPGKINPLVYKLFGVSDKQRLLNPIKTWAAIIDEVQKKDPMARAQLLKDVGGFGEGTVKAADQWLLMIEAMGQASDFGVILDDDQISVLSEFNKELVVTSNLLKGLSKQVSSSFAATFTPILKELNESFLEALPATIEKTANLFEGMVTGATQANDAIKSLTSDMADLRTVAGLLAIIGGGLLMRSGKFIKGGAAMSLGYGLLQTEQNKERTKTVKDAFGEAFDYATGLPGKLTAHVRDNKFAHVQSLNPNQSNMRPNINNDITININGARNTQSIASEVIEQLDTLNNAVQGNNAGFNSARSM